ncbi:MAG TPA: ATP-dependent Clp protease ATP-binding subunit [bacterium]
MSETKKYLTVPTGLAKLTQTFAIASRLARQHQRLITPDLLALALLEEPSVQTLLAAYVDVSALRVLYEKEQLKETKPSEAFGQLPEITKVLMSQAKSEVEGELEPSYLFKKIVRSDYAPIAKRFFTSHGITAQLINSQIAAIQSPSKSGRKVSETGVQNIERTPPPPDVLGTYCTDLTALAMTGKLFPVVGREEEIQQVLVTLNQPLFNRSGMLVGDIGVGKSSIIHGVAHLLVSKDCPPAFAETRLLSVDTNRIIGGAKYRGELEDRINAIIDALRAADGKTIIFWNKMHHVSGEGNTNIAKMMLSAVLRGEIKVIGATTFSEYTKMISQDPDIRQAFPPIFVDEPDQKETLEIVTGLQERFEALAGVKLDEEVPGLAVKLSVRYLSNEFNPSKTIALINQCCSSALLNGKTTVSADDVRDIVEQRTGIPTSKLKEQELEKLRELDKHICTDVIGQDDAVTLIAQAVKRNRTGFSDPNRPPSFIFLGPTGVGKTYLAKRLAYHLFDDENTMVRLDMSEYMEQFSVTRLTGAPPGYVGYEEGGQLTEAVRRNPYTVILLDEVEKAHPDVFNVLLQVMDDGRLTDGQGRLVFFKHAILIMTSNLGSGFYGQTTVKELILAEVKKFFRPEFLNRVDELIIFNQLTRENIQSIVQLELKKGVIARAAENKINLTFTAQAEKLLADQGFDPVYGARPLKRAIIRLVENELAEMTLGSKLREGDRLEVAAVRDRLQFNNLTTTKPKKPKAKS